MISTNALQAREEKRLAALRRTGLLDSPAEEIFDRLTHLATKILHIPFALISLIDSDRQFLKSKAGLPPELADIRDTPLSHSFCQYVAALGEPLVVSDSRQAPLVCDNLAVRDFNIIAYAGMPLITEDGYAIGSFCGIDVKPRDWTQHDLDVLKMLAAQVMAEVNLRVRLEESGEDLAELRAAQAEHQREVRQNIHDFRTPVTAMLIGLDGLEESGPLNQDQRTCSDLVKRSARELRDLINQLLELSEEEKNARIFTNCQPHEIVESAVEQVAPLAQRAGIAIDDDAVAPQETICADQRGLKRVFVNLLANAVKFTPRGGKIVVVLDKQTPNARNPNSADSGMRLIVADNGIGIEKENHARIFEDGARVNDDAPLTDSNGIGLGYCKRVVEEHGGEIGVESTPGKGSVFTVTIPSSTECGSEGRDRSADKVGSAARVKI